MTATVHPLRRYNQRPAPGQDKVLAGKFLGWMKGAMPLLYRDYIAPNANYIVHGSVPGGLLPAQSIKSVGLAGLGNFFDTISNFFTPTTFDMTAGAVAGSAPAVDMSVPIDTSSGGNWWDRLLNAIPSTVSTIGNALPALGQAYFQTQAMKINLDRAKQGLPPINTAAYAPGINVGVTPQTRNMLMYGAIGLAAVFVIMQLTKGKR